jgi:hypothetical protein
MRLSLKTVGLLAGMGDQEAKQALHIVEEESKVVKLEHDVSRLRVFKVFVTKDAWGREGLAYSIGYNPYPTSLTLLYKSVPIES